ncbi:MAG: hypothetical protein ACREEM_20545 [Blastocatellia bacterium]
MLRQSALAEDAPNCSFRFCYRSPQYLLNNYKRLRLFPRDIFISGVNLNHPVDCVSNPGPILFALRANSLNYTFSPLALFNQQYVAAQLTHAQAPLFTGFSAGKSSLSCYGLMFEPVKLTTGVEVTPTTTAQELFSLCDVTGIAAISEERDADMAALAKILQMLNTCQ